MSDRPSALLTNKQRKYILGRLEHENSTNERKMRSRIKNRVYAGIEQDGKFIPDMDPELRREIFREWEDRNYESHPSGIDLPKDDTPWTDHMEKSQFRFGIEGILQFLYLGVEEGGVGDFWEILEGAIDNAVKEKGKHVESFEPNIEFGELASLEDVHEMVESGELEPEELTLGEIGALLESGLMEPEDFPDGFLESALEGLGALEEAIENFDPDDVDPDDIR